MSLTRFVWGLELLIVVFALYVALIYVLRWYAKAQTNKDLTATYRWSAGFGPRPNKRREDSVKDS